LSGIGKGFPLRKICDSWGLGLIRTEGMPYSNDLRLRVLAAVDGGVPVRQVAALLRVSVSYIYKALNLLFGLGSISMAGVGRPLHGRRIYRRVPCGLLAFAAFDPIPISTGGGPNEGMDAPPPAINLDTIAGCALLAMPRRSRRRSACAANAVLVVIPARGGHHLVQTA
jgi:hypothetical protein